MKMQEEETMLEQRRLRREETMLEQRDDEGKR
jgi:hypothetical protein